MKLYILLFVPAISFAAALPPTPFPVFLRAGFSSVLEFDEAPSKLVLGDTQKFQVEKMDRSLVIKTIGPYASTNMFVYFRQVDPRLFILTASEDAQPTLYQKFSTHIEAKAVPTPTPGKGPSQRSGQILSARFDDRKDYLTIEFELYADSTEKLRPTWAWVRIVAGTTTIRADKLWAEREEVQKDSKVRGRAIFAKPNLPRNLKAVSLVVPIQGNLSPITLSLGRIGR